MNEKILSIVSPPVNGYPDYAYPLSIILNFDAGWNWMYCNFIQLYYEDRAFVNPVRFYYTDINNSLWNVRNPLLHHQWIQRNTFFSFNKDIIEFLVDSIMADNYIILYVDEYYIQNRWAYNLKHYSHMIFIYGFNQEKKIFYTAGYNQRLQYEHQEVSYQEISTAFFNNGNQYWDDHNVIYLMKYNIKGKKYELDINCIIEQLEEYLYSKNTSCRYNTFFNDKNLYFGYDIYEQLSICFKAIHEYNWSWNFPKPIYVLSEHKKLMADRIQFLEQKGILTDSKGYYDFFKKSADDLINHIIYLVKYQRQRKKEFIDVICSLINKIPAQEANIIKEIIEKLKHYQTTHEYKNHFIYSNAKIRQAIKSLPGKLEGNIQIEVEFALTSDAINGIIGFTDDKSIVNIINVVPMQLRMNNEGYFDAVNKDNYTNIKSIRYEKDVKYSFQEKEFGVMCYIIRQSFHKNQKVIRFHPANFQNRQVLHSLLSLRIQNPGNSEGGFLFP